jgi:hypothetical protein
MASRLARAVRAEARRIADGSGSNSSNHEALPYDDWILD